MLTEVKPDRPVVVVVEDNARVRASLERMLAPRYRPVGCATFDQALATLDDLPVAPLAMIIDFNLGSTRGDGLDVAVHARRRFRTAIPTLVLTGALDAEVSERANELRTELLVKPQATDALLRFLERAATHVQWRTADVIDLARAVDQFAHEHELTARQLQFLTAMMQAAERGEPPAINPNTRKAGMRRLLSKTGHATFDAVRLEIKRLAIQLG